MICRAWPLRPARRTAAVSLLATKAFDSLSGWLQRIAGGTINPVHAKRPLSLIYGVDDHPPITVTISNAVQQVCVIAINLVYPIVVFRAANAPVAISSDLLAVAMLVLAFGTFMQVLRLGPVGSGYMCPSTFTATYLAPSLLAARTGGLPLVFGMTLFAGLFETIIAPILNRLRGFFPPEISGLVIFMIGWSAGIAGLRVLLTPENPPVGRAEWTVAALTLVTMVIFNVWGRGLLRMTCAWIGLLAGYVAAAIMGVIDPPPFLPVLDAPWFGLPSFHVSWSFDPTLIAPFVVGSMAAAMKAA